MSEVSQNALGLDLGEPSQPVAQSHGINSAAGQHTKLSDMSIEYFSDSSDSDSSTRKKRRRDEIKPFEFSPAQPLPRVVGRAQSLDSFAPRKQETPRLAAGYQSPPDALADLRARLNRQSSTLSFDALFGSSPLLGTSLTSPIASPAKTDLDISSPSSQGPGLISPRDSSPERVKAEIRAGLTRHTIDDHYDKGSRSTTVPSYDTSNPYVKESRVPIGPAGHNKRADLYKTVMCRNWQESGDCRYGVRCQFAHGEEERQKYRQMAAAAKARGEGESSTSSPKQRSVRLSQSVSSLSSNQSSVRSSPMHHHRGSLSAFSTSSASTSSSSDVGLSPFTSPGTLSVMSAPLHEQHGDKSVRKFMSDLQHPSPRKQMTKFLVDRAGIRTVEEEDFLPLKMSGLRVTNTNDEHHTPSISSSNIAPSTPKSPWYPWPPSPKQPSSQQDSPLVSQHRV